MWQVSWLELLQHTNERLVRVEGLELPTSGTISPRSPLDLPSVSPRAADLWSTPYPHPITQRPTDRVTHPQCAWSDAERTLPSMEISSTCRGAAFSPDDLSA